jgi:phosphatidylinositol glycan class B
MVQKVLKYKIWNEIPLFYLFPLFICSYFSVGFHHFDEHFQILEYANYKMGYSPASDLPWEFGEKIRPTLQPWITVLFWKISNLFFEFNPFQFAFFLRFLTAVLSVVALVGIRQTFIHTVAPQNVNWYYRFSFLLWFMPFVMVRYSSETWSALFFAFGLIFTFSKPKIWKYFLAGLFFASSFWFRFQIAFAFIGLALWILVYEKQNWQRIVSVFLGFCLSSFIFYKLDCIFYQSQVFTPYNYYYQNIVLKVAENYGSFGVWYYPVMYLLHLIPPLSIVFLYVFIIFLKQNSKNVVSWIIFFFLLPHFVISHKELRFLFPLFVFVPFVFEKSMNLVLLLKDKWTSLYSFFIILNGILLFLSVLKPADINIFNLKQLTNNGEITKNFFLDKNFDKNYFPGLTMNYYQAFDSSYNGKNVAYIIDTISIGNTLNTPFLIQNNKLKYIFLTKMGDDFEKFKILRKENHPKD